jgi:hypothetical protein
MSVQDDIIYYYRRAAEARARGRDDLAQSMENYARNLEADIYNDDGRGLDIAASNKRWADKEAAQRKQAASRRQGEDNLYRKARPTMSPSMPSEYPSTRREYAPAREAQPSYSGYGPGYTEPPMDYSEAPQGSYQPQQSGHTGVVKFFDDGADVESWKRAHPEPETPRNKYGATRGSFLDYL